MKFNMDKLLDYLALTILSTVPITSIFFFLVYCGYKERTALIVGIMFVLVPWALSRLIDRTRG